MNDIKQGDFSALAADYSRYRPGYSELIVDCILAAGGKPAAALDAADVGAGTGIFTRLLAARGPRTLFGVEPNDNMRAQGERAGQERITWIGAPAEHTTLASGSLDLVTMASSFHWPDTAKALAEFDRLLRRGGAFAAVWNPRITERSSVEVQVDRLLTDKYRLAARVSSGRSGITTRLTQILTDCGYFRHVAYCESMDVVRVTPDHYLGAWRSVNDVRSQLGEARFATFLDDVRSLTSTLESIDVHYLTRAWIGRK